MPPQKKTQQKAQPKTGGVMARLMGALGYVRASGSGFPAFQGAALTRLNTDWVAGLLSADQEIRASLKRLRARCRQLHNNNDYAQRFVALLKQNVIGPTGVQLEVQVEKDDDSLNDLLNDGVEDAWEQWCKRGSCTVDGEMSFRDVQNVAMETVAVDGECFIRLVRGFGNDFRFALQFIDADQVDVNFNRPMRPENGVMQNEIRMGVELDPWGRRVAYHIFDGHPAEGHTKKIRVLAADMVHLLVIRRGAQTRGVPFMHTAMSRMNMLAGYEEAELVAARMGACKMGFFTSKTGEEYVGEKDAASGAIVTTVEPGHMDQLPDGVDVKTVDWQHPNAGFDAFSKSMIRGMAVGLNVTYAGLAGDLRDVNFSSIRQGVLDERDGWRCMQQWVVEHLLQPVFEAWLVQAAISGQLKVMKTQIPLVAAATRWQPRGWTWVDPLKDMQAAIIARGAGLTTLADICAQQGKDWRKILDQIAIENAYAKSKGVDLNFDAVKPGSIGTTPEAQPDPNAPPVPVDEGEDQ